MTVEQLRAELANLRDEKAGLIYLAEHEAREVNRLRAENERLREALVGAYTAMGDAAQRKNDMARLFAEHIYKAKEALK